MKSWAGVVVVAVTVGIAGQAAAQSPDTARGQRLFNQQCRACHTLEKGGASPAGPNLHGLFGRKAGTAEGYEFSEAMIKSGIVWDEETVAEYSRNPKGKVPGTKMVFAGVRPPAQTPDLVAYLKQATQ
ncbi:c-type cytochrome [Reyranella sp.]|uniref:c-type cytochrome n=1 Tax=Reyranella sp. TaxID=1929291 RepID=UPI003BAC57AC